MDSGSSAARSGKPSEPAVENSEVGGLKGPKPVTNTRKAPRPAAVMITGKEEGFSYAEALKKARGAISLDKLEIERTKISRATNGGLLIEVMGPGQVRL